MNPLSNFNSLNCYSKITLVTAAASTTCLVLTSMALEALSHMDPQTEYKSLNQANFITGCISAASAFAYFLPHFYTGMNSAEETEKMVGRLISEDRTAKRD